MPAPLKQALYRIPPLANLLRQSLNLAAPHGLTTVTVAAGDVAGLQMLLDLQAEKDYWLGTYEPELQAAVRTLVQPGMTVYDVGANIGYVTLLLARAVGAQGKVFSFEALPANLERLHRNLDLNDLTERVQVVGSAVVEAERPVHFLIGPSHGMGKAQGSAGRQEYTYPHSIQVPGISLDIFCSNGNPPPQIIKMDIEGGEVLALPGMRAVLRQDRPVLLMELHGPESAQAAWEMLIQCGYQICQMLPGFPAVASLASLGWKSYLVAFPLT